MKGLEVLSLSATGAIDMPDTDIHHIKYTGVVKGRLIAIRFITVSFVLHASN